MQCFERQAMYLKLFADAAAENPHLEFDANLFDEVLSDYAIEQFDALIALEDTQRVEIVMRINSMADAETLLEGDHAGSQDCDESEELADDNLPGEMLASNPRLTQSMLY